MSKGLPAASLPTPYDGSSAPFRIGLSLLDPKDWIEVDDNLPVYLDEKQRLAKERFKDIFAAEPGTEAAQAEVLVMLAEHLPKRFPDIYRRDGETVHILPTQSSVDLMDLSLPPLWRAALLVQEDLVLLRKQDQYWHVVAAALAFPSSWKLSEKAGRPIHEVHAPVPGFSEGTRNAGMIERMFDHLRPEVPVIRWNWALYSDDRLFHPESGNPQQRLFGSRAEAENLFIRVERQTLRRLPVSGDILFTIRIHHDPVAKLEKHHDATRLAKGLAEQLEGLDDSQLTYKGLAQDRDRLVARLMRIAADPA